MRGRLLPADLPRRCRLLPVAVLSLAILAACWPRLTSEEVLEDGPFGVGFSSQVLEDVARGRTMRSLLWYPAAPGGPAFPDAAARDIDAHASGGPYPLVVYSHGFMSFKEEGDYLVKHLASHGYVVIAPDFPFTNISAPGGPDLNDVVNQPGDVSFLIDTVLAWNATAGHRLEGVVDSERIGLTGLSLGGLTTLLTTYHPDLRDPRIDAAAPIASPVDFFAPEFYENARVPLLLILSELDAIIDFEASGEVAYDNAGAPLYFVRFFTASHTGWSGLAATIFENLPNADIVGCAALGGELPDDPEDPTFLDLLGGLENGITASSARPACSWGAQLLPALRPSRQHQLTILAVRPFLDLYLKRRDPQGAWRSADFLTHGLEAENSEELAVETKFRWQERRRRHRSRGPHAGFGPRWRR
jgi:dienelactone hydrolase